MQNIIHGDCLQEMRKMQDNSIDCILTDPPYGLRFMNKHWDHGLPSSDIWKEALRVCKPGAMMLAFGGTRTYHRLCCSIEDSGWEVRDCLMWIYGSGFPKSLDISKAIDKYRGEEREVIGHKTGRAASPVSDMRGGKMHAGGTTPGVMDCSEITAPSSDLAKTFDGYGTSLKPAYEPILLCMKPLDGTFAQNADKWGLAGINIDASRIGIDGESPRGSGQRKQNDIFYLGGKGNGGNETSSLGRWPANVIFDEEAAAMLDQMSGFSKSTNNTRNNAASPNTYMSGANTGHISYGHNDSGFASRFFYCPKASRKERGEGNFHPTVKPIKLLEYLLNLIMPPSKDSVVLDPFMGSGSTLLAAKNLGFNCIGIEIEKDYCQIAESRNPAAQIPGGYF